MNAHPRIARIFTTRALPVSIACAMVPLIGLASPVAAQQTSESLTSSEVVSPSTARIVRPLSAKATSPVVGKLWVRMNKGTGMIFADWKAPVGVHVKRYRVEVHRVTATTHCLDGGFTTGRSLRYGPVNRKYKYQVRVWVNTARGQGPAVVSAWLQR